MANGFYGNRGTHLLGVLILGMVSYCGVFAARTAEAAVVQTYEFSGESSGGVGSATMELSVQFDADINQWVLTAMIMNTSPTTTIGGGLNTPGITAFGFDLDPSAAWSSWTLEGGRYDSQSGQLQTDVLASNLDGGRWLIDNAHLGQSAELSYIAQTDQAHFGALYNPDLVTIEGTPVTGGPSHGEPTAYYSSATLTMWFDENSFSSESDNPFAGSTYVRMMRVGDEQEGSLRLTGTETTIPDLGPLPGPLPGPDVTSTPEPSSLLIWAGALVAMGVAVRRRQACRHG